MNIQSVRYFSQALSPISPTTISPPNTLAPRSTWVVTSGLLIFAVLTSRSPCSYYSVSYPCLFLPFSWCSYCTFLISLEISVGELMQPLQMKKPVKKTAMFWDLIYVGSHIRFTLGSKTQLMNKHFTSVSSCCFIQDFQKTYVLGNKGAKMGPNSKRVVFSTSRVRPG